MDPAEKLARRLLGDHLDPGYAQRAAQGRPSTRLDRVWMIAVLLVIGLILGAAAADAGSRAPATEQTRRGLVGSVRGAQQDTDRLGHRAQELGQAVEAARRAALDGDQTGANALAELRRLQIDAGTIEVTGPGMRITVDDKGDSRRPATSTSTVLDGDLQVLVNSLWSAGAEAISVNGIRLQPKSTIRQAGGAILIDNRPVGRPYVVEAIGAAAELHRRFLSTDAYGRFTAFSQLYGTVFTIAQADELRLPAGDPGRPRVATPMTSTSGR
ncbi:DUF881 domain-containing protein [Pseudonocardiaceae bacterium YIM PH 21723]|nr:DUF881 domain-containing protein [Pseudonocardiaceae bacterium YIM PH 21723]